MKLARISAVLLLVLSITCCMWIFASLAIRLLLPQIIPDAAKTSAEETIVGGVICLIAPATLAGASAIIWLTLVRRWPNAAAAPAPPAPPLLVASLDERRVEPTGAVLQSYLDKMIEVLVRHDVGAASSDGLRSVVRAETLMALRGLDPARKGRVLQCLSSAALSAHTARIDTENLDLNGIDLRFADLPGIDLAGASLRGANLAGANLRAAKLSGADLSGADLRLADLSSALLDRASLRQAKLHRANLRAADLREAALHEANLWEADLTGAMVTPEQVQVARSLAEATMPNRIGRSE